MNQLESAHHGTVGSKIDEIMSNIYDSFQSWLRWTKKQELPKTEAWPSIVKNVDLPVEKESQVHIAFSPDMNQTDFLGWNMPI